MNRETTIEHAITYLISKRSDLPIRTIAEILYVADLHHYILYGRTIIGMNEIEKYEMNVSDIDKIYKARNTNLTVNELDMLSDSDKESIEFALLRYEADFTRVVTDIKLKG